MYDDCMILSLRFPQKLWRIVNECRTGAIRWGLHGSTILLDYKKFQEQYLDPSASIFKTKNITSFIRQLNLYGFRKVTSHNRDPACNSHNPDVHEFLHENFRSSRPDLLGRVCRKTTGKPRCQHLALDVRNAELPAQPRLPEVASDPASRLELCRLALTKALEQIRKDYRQTISVAENESQGIRLRRAETEEYQRPQSSSDRSSDETYDCTCLAFI